MMNRAWRATSVAVVMALGWGCPASSDDLCANDACADLTNTRCLNDPTSPTCMNDGTALFVSPNGDDASARGTRAAPYKTLGATLGKLSPFRRRIYVCDGTYVEDVKLSAAESGVAIFGGVDCFWRPAPGVKPVIGASARPFTIDKTTAFGLVDLAVVAKDASSGSSIAVFAFEASGIFRSVVLSAGVGADGGRPGDPAPPSAQARAGASASGTRGGAATPSDSCAQLSPATKGGLGGSVGGVAPSSGEPALDGGTAGAGTDCDAGGSGRPGAPGNVGSLPPETTALGVLTATGWVPASGSDGNPGSVGQGGGGGAAGATGGGGGGGAGGCSGTPGRGGTGGGGSIALVAAASTITIVTSTLQTNNGGGGGYGGDAQSSQAGGAAGAAAGDGCPGGAGGEGGRSIGGRGGAGGISVGILFRKTPPTLDAATRDNIRVAFPNFGGIGAGTLAVKGVAEKVFETQ